MPVALIGAGVAAAGSVAGAAISASGAKSAANTAAQAANSNNALQQQIYQQNTANATPFMERGNAAGAQINALLGLGGSASQPTQDWNSYLSAYPDVANDYANNGGISHTLFPTAQSYAQWHYGNFGRNEGRTAPAAGPSAAQNAFNTFRNSDGYQFRLGEGLKAVNSNFATRGALNSGAALKSLNNYAQGQASNEFGNYIGALQNQQGVGLSATNAVAGVGTNYANAVSANNNNAANAAGNASLASANAINQGIFGVTGALGTALGSQSSYGSGVDAFTNAFNKGFNG